MDKTLRGVRMEQSVFVRSFWGIAPSSLQRRYVLVGLDKAALPSPRLELDAS